MPSCHLPFLLQMYRFLYRSFLIKPLLIFKFCADDLRNFYKDKCNSVGKEENTTLHEEVENASMVFATCVYQLGNWTNLQAEIEEARPIGELDTVFHNYCEKVPRAEMCLKRFTEVIRPCLNQDELEQSETLTRLVNSLLGFMCARGGDQIALFVAEDGPECMEANKNAIAYCANITLSKFPLPAGSTIADLAQLPQLLFKPEHCVDLEQFETCTLRHLEMCRDITPANVVESIFRFIKTETNCKTWLEDQTKRKSIWRDDLEEYKLRNSSSNNLLFHCSYTLLVYSFMLVIRSFNL